MVGTARNHVRCSFHTSYRSQEQDLGIHTNLRLGLGSPLTPTHAQVSLQDIQESSLLLGCYPLAQPLQQDCEVAWSTGSLQES